MKVGFRALGIDPGYKNFSWCVLERDWKRPVRWANEALFEGEYDEEKLWRSIYAWCTKHEQIINEADVIVIERQIMDAYRIIAATIRTFARNPGKSVIIAPNTMAKHFKLPHSRAEKKKAAVRLVEKNLRIPVPEKAKKDDYADAFLLAYMGLELPGIGVGDEILPLKN